MTDMLGSSSSLSREDQKRFWDRQAAHYSDAAMTNDNGGELTIVRQLCAQIGSPGGSADIVTFGGADGCRDPKVIVETFAIFGHTPEAIYFNDLSAKMVRQAQQRYLERYAQDGIRVHAISGNVSDIVGSFPARPRRVIIGGYHIEAFLKASRSEGYPLCGLDEYVHSAPMLGNLFELEWCDITKRGYERCGKAFRFDARDISHLSIIRTMLDSFSHQGLVRTPGALRVTARHTEEGEPFISHWYNDAGFLSLIRCGFEGVEGAISMHRCAKGIVACIDPEGSIQGVVSMLNNVVGNMLPEDVVTNLKAIHAISR